MSYEQMELDCRLDSERNLDENIIRVIDFAHGQLKAATTTDTVKNRFEGYGLLSDGLDKVAGATKKLNDDMKKFLMVLSSDDRKAIDAVSSVGNSLSALAAYVVRMAAQARRVSDDLYEAEASSVSELESYYASKADDGFEEMEDDE